MGGENIDWFVMEKWNNSVSLKHRMEAKQEVKLEVTIDHDVCPSEYYECDGESGI